MKSWVLGYGFWVEKHTKQQGLTVPAIPPFNLEPNTQNQKHFFQLPGMQ